MQRELRSGKLVHSPPLCARSRRGPVGGFALSEADDAWLSRGRNAVGRRGPRRLAASVYADASGLECLCYKPSGYVLVGHVVHAMSLEPWAHWVQNCCSVIPSEQARQLEVMAMQHITGSGSSRASSGFGVIFSG